LRPIDTVVQIRIALIFLLFDQNVLIGIHPNLNDLLEGTNHNGLQVVDRVKKLIDLTEGAKVVRSHSMTQNSRVLDTFAELGITHDCNHYIPHYSGIHLKPWKIWNGITKVPYFWEDDLNIKYSDNHLAEILSKVDGLKVFDFHPIHIFLNTKELGSYQVAKTFQKDFKKLSDFRFNGYGTENFLRDLIENHLSDQRNKK
jgi:hypothetical protein